MQTGTGRQANATNDGTQSGIDVVGRPQLLTQSDTDPEEVRYCSHCGCKWPVGRAFPDETTRGTVCDSCQCEEPHRFLSKGEFVVEGMCCTACQTAVEKALKRVNGVQNVRVSYVFGKAHVDYDPRIVNLKQIEQAIKNSGYRCIVQGRVQPGSYVR
jgi:copper chaperone CopZ